MWSVITYFLCLDLDQLCSLDIDVWEHLMGTAADPPLFFSETFECLADHFLSQYYGIDRSIITPTNIREIYCHMVDYFSS